MITFSPGSSRKALKKVRILHLLAQRPGYTGSGIYLRSIVEQAEQDGCEQAVICGVPSDEKVRFESVRQPLIYPVWFESESLPFPVTGMSDVMPYPSTMYRELNEPALKLWKAAFDLQLKLALKEFVPDIILSHHLWLLSAMAKKAADNIPVLVIAHGTALRQKQFCPLLANEIIPHLRQVDKVLVLNEVQKQRIFDQFGIAKDKIIITGSGYNEKLFYPQPGPKRNVKKLIYAGKIARAKGLNELFSALDLLYNEGKRFELTVCGAGSGAEERELKSRAATAHYIVDFTGNLSQAELADRFRLNDIFILPSYYEGLPLVLIEALASELHVVVNDLPGIKSWLGDDLCNSKQIEFVKLPTLCNIDKPVIEEIPAYVSRLHIAIRNALRNHSGTNDRNLNIIRNHTWKAVFQKIGLQIEKAVL